MYSGRFFFVRWVVFLLSCESRCVVVIELGVRLWEKGIGFLVCVYVFVLGFVFVGRRRFIRGFMGCLVVIMRLFYKFKCLCYF